MPGHHDDGKVGIAAVGRIADLTGERHAVHRLHLEVDDGQVRLPHLQDVERLGSALRRADMFDAVVGQQHADNLTHVRIIVGEQDAQGFETRGHRVSDPVVRG